MRYSEFFARAILSLYGTKPDLDRQLAEGGPRLGRCLGRETGNGMDPQRVLDLLNDGKTGQLEAEARACLLREGACAGWAADLGRASNDVAAPALKTARRRR